ncbi:hypothetical protein ACGTN9_00845 [Halobacillus sp. MO56]
MKKAIRNVCFLLFLVSAANTLDFPDNTSHVLSLSESQPGPMGTSPNPIEVVDTSK